MLKVTYFKIRGRAEIIRLLLHAANQKFEDCRVGDEWPKLKPTIPYGQLPVLTLTDDKVMNESMAIARYLARKHGLYGANEWEAYLIDRILELVNEVFTKMMTANFEKDETRKGNLQKDFQETVLPNYFNKLTKYITEGGGKFAAGGSKATLGDLIMIVMWEYIPAEVKTKFPTFLEHYNATLAAFPAVKKYIDTRPVTDI